MAKAEEQEKLLQESNNELEERRRRAEQLRKELEEKEVKIDDSWLCPIQLFKKLSEYREFHAVNQLMMSISHSCCLYDVK